jgi:hypothetical protein
MLRSFIVTTALAASLLSPHVSFAWGRGSGGDGNGDGEGKSRSKQHEAVDKEYDQSNKEIEESPAPGSWKDYNKQANEIFRKEDHQEIDK